MKKNIKFIIFLTLLFLTISSILFFQFFKNYKNKIEEKESEIVKYHVCTSDGLWLEAIPWLLWLDYDWNSNNRKIDFDKNICIIFNDKWEQFYIKLDYLYNTIVRINSLFTNDSVNLTDEIMKEKWENFWNSLKKEFQNEVWILKN